MQLVAELETVHPGPAPRPWQELLQAKESRGRVTSGSTEVPAWVVFGCIVTVGVDDRAGSLEIRPKDTVL